jgi:hypothetical protein
MDMTRNNTKTIKNDTKNDRNITKKDNKVNKENKVSMSKTGPLSTGTDLIIHNPSPAASSSVGRIFHLLPQVSMHSY